MHLTITTDYQELSRTGADIISALIAAKPDATILLATGNTPMGLYKELAARRARGELDASHLRVFQLDEYVGIPPEDDRSLYGWMERSFVQPLGVPEPNVVRLPWDPEGIEEGCAAYDLAVEQVGGFDLAVLGLGPNGHLGFNEPPSGPDAPTRRVVLTPASIQSNAAYWGGPDRVPREAVTAGMPHLLAARRILLVVSGAHKQQILRRTLTEPPTPQVPSSYLQQAAGLTVLADRAAWPGQLSVVSCQLSVVRRRQTTEGVKNEL
jgi:glucosamine-6-phosphate deaminase